VGGGAGTPAGRALAKIVLESREQESSLVQAAAGKWQAGLAGQLAVVTSTISLGLGKELWQLNRWVGYAVGALLIVALALALVALLVALRSSGGLPRLVRPQTLGGLGHRDAMTAARLLRVAVGFSIASLSVFVVALGLAWFGPREAKDSYAIISTGTAEICGKVEIGPTFVTVTTDEEHVYPIELGSIVSWIQVGKCPAAKPSPS